LPDSEDDYAKRKIHELATDIVNELLKSGEPMRVDISTGGTAEKCGPNFKFCGGSYECIKKFKCENAGGFNCGGGFKDSADFTMTLG
jgi:hypothetical protein